MEKPGEIIAKIYSKKWELYIKYNCSILYFMLIGFIPILLSMLILLNDLMPKLLFSTFLIIIILFLIIISIDIKNEPVILFENGIQPHELHNRIFKRGKRNFINFIDVKTIEYEDFPDEWITCHIIFKDKKEKKKFIVDNAIDLNLILKVFKKYNVEISNN